MIEELVAGDLGALDPHPGMRDLKQLFPRVKAALPDFGATLVQQLVQEDRVATHWIFRGTHEGELFGIAPTG